MYPIRRAAESRFVTWRQHRHHLRCWGTPRRGQTPLVMLHGWMDVSASFQFVVDALVQDRFVVAPDWRGFGLTRAQGLKDEPNRWSHSDHYVFPDYLADLDALLDHLAQDQGHTGAPVDLVGHSMGANIAMLYAGVRPQRVRRLVNLEGFGMPAAVAAQAPSRLARWLDELQRCERGELALSTYDNPEGVARRLMRTNPRLPLDKALWLAERWAAPNADGRWRILGDAAHKVVSASLYRLDEVLATHARITAPVLAVEAADDSLARWYQADEHSRAEHHRRLGHVPNCRIAVVADAGHMLHHDQPAAVAALVEAHLG